jgi:hypothetical protein
MLISTSVPSGDRPPKSYAQMARRGRIGKYSSWRKALLEEEITINVSSRA